MSRVVTLTTDFGLSDAYVAVMKGVILTRAPNAQLTDITHQVPPQDLRTAKRIIQETFHYFPPGSIHLVVVDPGVGTERLGIMGQYRGHLFVSPDNGVLGFAMEDSQSQFWRIDEKLFTRGDGETFHGRDVFAPVAGELAAGESPEKLGSALKTIMELNSDEPQVRGGEVFGEVIQVDSFGNLITNIKKDCCNGRGVVKLGQSVVGPICSIYADVAVGSVLALINSSGRLEIAVRNGSAKESLGVGRGTKVIVCKEVDG